MTGRMGPRLPRARLASPRGPETQASAFTPRPHPGSPYLALPTPHRKRGPGIHMFVVACVIEYP